MRNFTKTIRAQWVLMLIILLGLLAYNNLQTTNNTISLSAKDQYVFFSLEGQQKEQQFFVNAIEIHLVIIRMGQLAQRVSKVAEVKELGKRMEEAHTTYINKLMMMAEKKSVSLTQLEPNQTKDTSLKLSNTSDTNFDATYCDMTVNKHKNIMAVFKALSLESTDRDIKNWAKYTLDELDIHLDHAVACQSKYSE